MTYLKKEYKSPRICRNCGKQFISTTPNQNLCGPACIAEWKRRSYQKKELEKPPRICRNCGKQFISKSPNQKSCGPACTAEWQRRSYQKKEWDKSPRICRSCCKQFIPKSSHQKSCGPACTAEWQRRFFQKKEWDMSPRSCKLCGNQFTPTSVSQVFCSSVCRQHQSKITAKKHPRERSPENPKKIPVFRNFCDLRFWDENHFEEWFRNNYSLFGLKVLHKIDRMFPDVLAETYDGLMLRIELELCSPNFAVHGHDPKQCDLVISFVKPFKMNTVRGVPVLALFNATGTQRGFANYDADSLELTDYFKALVTFMNNSLLRYLEKHPSFDSRRIPQFLKLYKKIDK